jgi:hypothetical protein
MPFEHSEDEKQDNQTPFQPARREQERQHEPAYLGMVNHISEYDE